MAKDYIPRRDDDFLQWAMNMRNLITTSPETFGLTLAQADHYADLYEAFAAAYRTAIEPSTRTKPSVNAKNEARRTLEREARRLARLIQATTSVTDAQKAELGLTVRNSNATPVARPLEPPVVFVKLRFGSTVRVTLRSRNTTRKGKPEGVAGAMLFSYIGDYPPATLDGWRLEGQTTRPQTDMTFSGDEIVPGAKVWVTTYWYNPRGEAGPAAEPKSTFVQCPTLWFEKAERRKAA